MFSCSVKFIIISLHFTSISPSHAPINLTYNLKIGEISQKFIPITYDSINTVNNGVQSKSKKNIYKNSIIQSNILKQGNEKRQGYGLVLSSSKYRNPSWYYQMGKTKNWDGIDLILKKFNHRSRKKGNRTKITKPDKYCFLTTKELPSSD